MGQELVDRTVSQIHDLEARNQLSENDYQFLCYLLSRQELSSKDVTMITLSLFTDGLGTVSISIYSR